jgi:tetratricopeptide (TPR) repeat protein
MDRPGEHLEDDLLVAFLAGRIADDERAEVEHHIDGCTACRELVSALAASGTASGLEPTGDAATASADAGPPSDDDPDSGAPPLLPGDRVGDRFTVEGHAGKGGMGHVYRARDDESGARVALKTMRIADPGLARRFEREARVLEELQDPAVVRYVARGTTALGQAFLVMEWVEGESVSQRLLRGPLGVPATLQLVRRVAGGLAAAHARGIVHRDVKPANVLLPDGDVERAVLIDFGIARTQRPGTAATRRGAFLGTPGYMAPEQARGGGALDARADVFSLGCVAYQCLTGKVPFAGADFLEMLAKLLLETPRPASETAPDVPPALDRLLARMLAKEPDARPADAAALLVELDVAAEGGPGRPRFATGAGGARMAMTVAALVAAASLVVGVGVWRTKAHAPDHVAQASVADASAAIDPAKPALVLIVGIENRTVNMELEGTADALFAAGVAPSSRFQAFTGPELRGRVAAVNPGGGKIDDDTARALGEKEHRRVIVVRGTVASREGGYDLDLEASDPSAHETLFHTRDQPADSAALVQAITDRACELRHQLGEPATSCTMTMSTSLEADHEIMLGSALLDSGQYESAIAHYSHAVALDPSFARARFYLATSLGNAGRHADALRELDTLLHDPSATARLTPKMLLLAQVDAAKQRGDFSQAVALIEPQLASYPGDPTLKTRLSNSYAAMGKWDEALAIGRRALDDSPKAAVLRANILYYEFGKGDLAAVLRDAKALEDGLRAVPDSALFFPALAQAIGGDDAAARATIERMKKQNRPGGANLEADLDAWRGRGADGITVLEEALAHPAESDDPEETASAWSTLAALELAAGDRDGALAAAAHATAAKGEHTRWTLGRVYIGTNHRREAEAIAAQLHAEPAPFARMVGACLEAELAAARKDPRTRLFKAREAVALHDSYLSRSELAHALLAAGQTDQARTMLEADRARPWEGAIAFDDLVSSLRDMPAR